MKQYRVDRPSKAAVAPDNAITGALARAAYEEHYLGAFWHVYLPEGREFPSCATPYTNGGWTVPLPKLYGTSPVIRKIMLAVSLVTEGQASGRAREMAEGLKYYTSSLQRIAGALRDGESVDHLTLVITTRLFSLYEVSALPSSSLTPVYLLLFYRPVIIRSRGLSLSCLLTGSVRPRLPGLVGSGGKLAETH